MPLLLHIDTALATGSVSLSLNNQLLASRLNDTASGHAAWIHTAIGELLVEAGYSTQDIKAVAVSNGPGSYTGLRIGLSTAKGICFAMKIPLISISTLEIMAASVLTKEGVFTEASGALCPMIDARRMEAYFAIYDSRLSPVLAPGSAVISPALFDKWLQQGKLIFFGDGSNKLKNILKHPHASFYNYSHQGAIDMISLSTKYYNKNIFVDLAYAEPLYLKEFYNSSESTR